MVEHGTALVPTLINVENFPGIADSATRYRHTARICVTCTPSASAVAAARTPACRSMPYRPGSMVAHGGCRRVEAHKGIG